MIKADVLKITRYVKDARRAHEVLKAGHTGLKPADSVQFLQASLYFHRALSFVRLHVGHSDELPAQSYRFHNDSYCLSIPDAQRAKFGVTNRSIP